MPQERHPTTKTPFRRPKPGLWSNKLIRTKDASIPISVLSTWQLRSILAHLHRNAHQWRRTGEGDLLKDSIQMGRGGQPEKVAREILWLASAEASFATGAFLVVIGGK